MSSYLLPYSAGTISLENGSKVVTGLGTAFGIAVKPGDLLQAPDGLFYALGAAEITNTGFELVDDYAGPTVSDAAYKIHRVSPGWGDVASVNARVADLIEGVQRLGGMRSVSEVEIGTGEKTFVVNTALPILSGARLNISSTVPGEEASHTMNGVVKSLVGQTMIVDAVFATGAGQTRSNWNINISGLLGDVTPEAEAARDAAIEAKEDAEDAAGAAGAAAAAASLSADAASDSKDDAESAATAAAVVQTNLRSYLLSPKSADPSVDDNGDPLQVGTRYYNTTTGSERIYNEEGAWDTYTPAEGMAALVDDTAPQLGGDLDLNGFDVPVSPSVAGALAEKADADVVVRHDAPQSLDDTERAQARSNIYAAPFDAMAYHGLQVNGFQQISQENGNAAVASGGYPVDNEIMYAFGNLAASAKRIGTAPFSSRPDIVRAIEIEILTADASIGSDEFLTLLQSIEGERLRGRLAWGTAGAKPVSIGRVIRSSVSGRFCVGVRNGASNRSYVHAFDLVADTDTYVSVTIPGDTAGVWAVDNTAGLQVLWTFACDPALCATADAWHGGNYLATSDISNLAASVGNKVWLGPMVVLPGIELPTFGEIMKCQRFIDDELRACRRYFFSIGGNAAYESAGVGFVNNPTTATIWLPLSSEMRVTPSLAVSAVGHWSIATSASNLVCTSIVATASNAPAAATLFAVVASGLASGDCVMLQAYNTLSARIDLIARF